MKRAHVHGEPPETLFEVLIGRPDLERIMQPRLSVVDTDADPRILVIGSPPQPS